MHHFGSGELLFDGQAPWVVKLMKIFRWGIRDGQQLEQWNPRLKYVEETSPMARFAEIPVRSQRLVFRMCNAIPAAGRANRQFRFRF